MLIFGRDAGLLAAAAKTALGIEGADFTAVKELGSEVKNVVVAGWAEPSTVHTFHVDADCDPDDVVRVRGFLLGFRREWDSGAIRLMWGFAGNQWRPCDGASVSPGNTCLCDLCACFE